MVEGGESGFTLIEALIAITVLAVSAISLLAATEAHVSRVGALERRVAARLVAENRLSEMEAGAPMDGNPVEMLGERYTVDVARTGTADPDLERLDFTVLDSRGVPAFSGFVGFLAKPITP